MMFFSCMVQAEQAPAGLKAELESRLAELGGTILGAPTDSAKFNWVEIAPGHGYTAAEPSTSSLVLAVVPDGTDQETRVKFMDGICSLWMDVTGCTLNEIVATAADATLFAQADL